MDRVAAEPANTDDDAAAAVCEQEIKTTLFSSLQVSSRALSVRWEKRKQMELRWLTWQVDKSFKGMREEERFGLACASTCWTNLCFRSSSCLPVLCVCVLKLEWLFYLGLNCVALCQQALRPDYLIVQPRVENLFHTPVGCRLLTH